MVDQNPFTPGQPAPVDLFVGREREIRALVSHVKQAATGKLQVAFLSGERGIGKSSLAAFVRYYAEVEDNLIGAHVFLGGAHDLHEMIRRIFDKLLKESVEKKWYERAKDLFGKSVDKVGLFGLNVQLKASDEDLEALVRGFPLAIRKLTERLRGDKDSGKTGIILILDDINGLADEQPFADWLKSTIDEIAVAQEATPLCLLLVGLEERRQAMIARNASLARAFHVFPIAPWSDAETETFLREALGRAGVTADEASLRELARYAGGLPVLAHELGEAAYHRARGGKLSADDAISAILDAAKVVGVKHLQPQVLEAIRSTNYRNTLEKIAAKVPIQADATFEKAEVLSLLTEEESRNFHNFLQRMIKLGVLTHGASQGQYRFATVLHHVYLWMQALRKAPGLPASSDSEEE